MRRRSFGPDSGMILPTSLFETFKHPLVSPLISPITCFFVSFLAVFLCGFPPGLTTWRPIWCAATLPSSSRKAASHLLLRRKPRPRPFRLCSRVAPIAGRSYAPMRHGPGRHGETILLRQPWLSPTRKGGEPVSVLEAHSSDQFAHLLGDPRSATGRRRCAN